MSDKLLFTCRVCGVEVSTHGFTVNEIGEEVGVQGVCEEHCEDHEYEYEPYERGSFCVHCGIRQEYEPSDDDVGFGTYYEPRDPIGIPASEMDGNASVANKSPEHRRRWDNWVSFCESWGAP
jgi:hypothetical protein